MKVSVVIPTHRRPAELARCLDALARQDRLPDEILLAVRDDDSITPLLLHAQPTERFPVRVVPVGLADASTARDRCVALARGGIVAFTDDDAAPRPDWIARIRSRFLADARLGAIGGPDWIGGRETPRGARARRVGAVQWWGRLVGNHHVGTDQPTDVEWLKGANMSFRREALAGVTFASGLRGRHAQFGEDVAGSLAVRRAGWRVRYDPAIALDHYPAGLPAGTDHRALGDEASLRDAAYNDALALCRYLPPVRRIAFLLWSLLVGTRLLPGLAAALVLAGRVGLASFRRARVVAAGRLDGWRAWRAERRPSRRAPAFMPLARRSDATR